MFDLKKVNTILKKIKPHYNVIYFKTIDSTNNFALNSDLSPDNIIVADRQIKGRGRQGRVWNSDEESNLYFTLVLENNNFIDLFKMNIISAYALCDVMKSDYSINSKVKWPNDVVVDGKKVSGVLLEARMEGNKLKKVVLGIGVNLNNKEFPDELKHRAVSIFQLKGEKINKEYFFIRFFEEFAKWERKLNLIKEYWVEYSAHLNEEIMFHYNNNVEKFIEKGINDDGSLIVKDMNGKEKIIYYGEIGYDTCS
ncbi:biotin--[acetyl-CoA-carboxylase] ligase [Deferribacter autotrophicus]|uniref:Biotin--[acetyl-CoA-carboxylase] ligase n=1 Tax=Deferribacter autotrophicus TaxID=500465 RepID=A0A5A8F547_9BACT|nr:biotin--[acetyl-CoA-carboxylase] ligase [Deferribacter autotrophicus]KAA0259239.1 biotin--[acetyl-CoA-carboxylase] ligase [Deferribacter autotrophicus]